MKDLEKILKFSPVRKVSESFSSEVMDKVYSAFELEKVAEASLDTLLSNQKPLLLDTDLSSLVMKDLLQPVSHKPLINGKVLAIIVLVVLAILAFALSTSGENFGFSVPENFQISPLYPISILALGVLLSLDYFLRTKLTSKSPNEDL